MLTLTLVTNIAFIVLCGLFKILGDVSIGGSLFRA